MSIDRTVAPPVTDFGTLIIPPKSTLILPQGISLNTIRTGDSPANRFSLVWNYGGCRCGGSYAASMVAPMLLQGCSTMTGSQIVDRVDYLGAFLNHTTYSGHTSFETLSLNEFTPRMLDLLAKIILEPVFPADRFEALKRKAIATFEVNRTRTRVCANDMLSALVAGKDHPYDIPNTLEDLEGLTLNMVRDAWSEGVFGTDMQIFASGDIDDAMKSHIINFAHAVRPEKVALTATVPVAHQPESAGVRHIDMPDACQSSIAIGIPTIGRQHPDYIALRIAIVALGGYFGSRLMTNIREEKGLTYGISASLMGTHEGGSINIQADCDSSYVSTVLAEIDNEIGKLADTPMDSAEFARLRSYYMTTIAATLESFKSIGEYYENQYTIGLPPNYFEMQQSVLASLTPEKLRDTAAKYIDIKNAITVVAGPTARF